MEDDVGAGQQLLPVLLADGQVTVVEVCINSSDLLAHVRTHFFDFFKQLKRKYKSIYRDHHPHHLALVLTGLLHVHSQQLVLVVTHEHFAYVHAIQSQCSIIPAPLNLINMFLKNELLSIFET